MTIDIDRRAHKSLSGKEKEATIIEGTMRDMIDAHGFRLVLYVTNHVIYDEKARLKLEQTIADKEKELEDLKKKASA